MDNYHTFLFNYYFDLIFSCWWRMKINLISRKLSVITGRNLRKEKGSASMILQLQKLCLALLLDSEWCVFDVSLVTVSLSTLSRRSAKLVLQNQKNLEFLACRTCKHFAWCYCSVCWFLHPNICCSIPGTTSNSSICNVSVNCLKKKSDILWWVPRPLLA